MRLSGTCPDAPPHGKCTRHGCCRVWGRCRSGGCSSARKPPHTTARPCAPDARRVRSCWGLPLHHSLQVLPPASSPPPRLCPRTWEHTRCRCWGRAAWRQGIEPNDLLTSLPPRAVGFGITRQACGPMKLAPLSGNTRLFSVLQLPGALLDKTCLRLSPTACGSLWVCLTSAVSSRSHQ